MKQSCSQDTPAAALDPSVIQKTQPNGVSVRAVGALVRSSFELVFRSRMRPLAKPSLLSAITVS
jgi:hypothetical protein